MWHVPFHREQFLRMIEKTVEKYLEKCFSKYKSCIMTVGDELNECISGQWAQNPELVRIVCQNSHFKNLVHITS
jgi:hypothetical protein